MGASYTTPSLTAAVPTAVSAVSAAPDGDGIVAARGETQLRRCRMLSLVASVGVIAAGTVGVFVATSDGATVTPPPSAVMVSPSSCASSLEVGSRRREVSTEVPRLSERAPPQKLQHYLPAPAEDRGRKPAWFLEDGRSLGRRPLLRLLPKGPLSTDRRAPKVALRLRRWPHENKRRRSLARSFARSPFSVAGWHSRREGDPLATCVS